MIITVHVARVSMVDPRAIFYGDRFWRDCLPGRIRNDRRPYVLRALGGPCHKGVGFCGYRRRAARSLYSGSRPHDSSRRDVIAPRLSNAGGRGVGAAVFRAFAAPSLRPPAFDRNMLVKHNLLDSFRVSGLVLVGFVGGLTRGFYNCLAGSRVGNVSPTCQETLIINVSVK